MEPENDTLINIARFSFGLNMFTTLPLELFVCREVRNIFLPVFYRSYDTTSCVRIGNRAVFFLARSFQYATTYFLHHRYPRLRHVQCVPELASAPSQPHLPACRQYRSLRAISV